MIAEDILREKAKTYLVCYQDQCPLHSHCLRWQAAQYVPDRLFSVRCVNPKYQGCATEACPAYRSDQPQRIPVGMVKFYDAMPGKMVRAIKGQLIERFSRVVYYQYRRGERDITPAIEQEIARICQECGWTAAPQYDGYTEKLIW